LRPVFEGAHDQGHRRDAGFLDRSSNVPDRHMADRSDRYEEHHVDVFLVDPLDPAGQLPAQPTL
jgi:hypothetical protein